MGSTHLWVCLWGRFPEQTGLEGSRLNAEALPRVLATILEKQEVEESGNCLV